MSSASEIRLFLIHLFFAHVIAVVVVAVLFAITNIT